LVQPRPAITRRLPNRRAPPRRAEVLPPRACDLARAIFGVACSCCCVLRLRPEVAPATSRSPFGRDNLIGGQWVGRSPPAPRPKLYSRLPIQAFFLRLFVVACLRRRGAAELLSSTCGASCVRWRLRQQGCARR